MIYGPRHSANIVDADDDAVAVADDDVGVFNYESRFFPQEYESDESKKKLFVIVNTCFSYVHTNSDRNPVNCTFSTI